MKNSKDLIHAFFWLGVKKKEIGLVAILFFLVFSSLGYAQDQTQFLSTEDARKVAYQSYLKDQDKKSSESNYLLSLIESSSLLFERNGQKGSGKIAGKILKYKFNQYKKLIRSTEDFIEKVASFSSHSNKSYFVVIPGGKKLLLKDMLYAELNKLRDQNKEMKGEVGGGAR